MRRKFAVLATLGALLAVVPQIASAAVPTASTAPVDAPAASIPASAQPDLGPNVLVFDPSMPTAQIQAAVDAVAAQQVTNQFGSERYALLFKPGTYGTATEPLIFEVGYYTAVAGLGLNPADVVINGAVYVHNQCDANGFCIALNNFWRSLSNLTINVSIPAGGCFGVGEFWAVSQAAPMRRVNVNGFTTLMDFCSGPSFASGGFIADSAFNGSVVVNGSQQQWVTRNSNVDTWTNGVWNQVFSGVAGAPAECFGVPGCGPYTTLATSPVTREAPYLYVDGNGRYNVFVPAAQRNTSGTSWANGPTPGTSLPLSSFYVAKPGDRAERINDALDHGRNVLFTPGVYQLNDTLEVDRSGTVVLGIGLPTLVPTRGNATMKVDDVTAVKLAGLMFDAGPRNSPVLLQVGEPRSRRSNPTDPTTLSDVFFRIGGATPGKASTSLVVNSDNVILDDIWAWRADHGNGVGWTANTADTGVIVNGANVTAYGLFVEHYQKTEVIWNGNGGTVVFFQNELPYDVPSQAAWMSSPTTKGYPALKINDKVTSFNGYGMGSYSFFNQGLDIFADHAFEAPATLPPGSLHDLLTIFLDPVNGKGGILNVVNGIGGSSTVANPDVPVTVANFP